MLYVIRRLLLGIALIVVASSVLLISDWSRRKPGVSAGDRESAETPKANSRRSTGAQTGQTRRKWNVHIVEFTNILDVDEAEAGILDGLREMKLEKGKDFELTIRNANGDMSTVSALIDASVTEKADLLITMSTPTLQAAIRRGGTRPIVFTVVASAVAAGAGKTNDDHLPHLTGILTTAAFSEMLSLIRELVPAARKIGTLFVPGEVNSVYYKDEITLAAQKYGMDVVAVPINTPIEIPDAANTLIQKDVDVVCQLSGNLTASALPSVVNAASRKRIPIFAFLSKQAAEGASLVLARDFYDAGKEAAYLAARIMRGESPARIPIRTVRKTNLIINLKAAKHCGLKIPEEILKQATHVIQ